MRRGSGTLIRDLNETGSQPVDIMGRAVQQQTQRPWGSQEHNLCQGRSKDKLAGGERGAGGEVGGKDRQTGWDPPRWPVALEVPGSLFSVKHESLGGFSRGGTHQNYILRWLSGERTEGARMEAGRPYRIWHVFQVRQTVVWTHRPWQGCRVAGFWVWWGENQWDLGVREGEECRTLVGACGWTKVSFSEMEKRAEQSRVLLAHVYLPV